MIFFFNVTNYKSLLLVTVRSLLGPAWDYISEQQMRFYQLKGCFKEKNGRLVFFPKALFSAKETENYV